MAAAATQIYFMVWCCRWSEDSSVCGLILHKFWDEWEKKTATSVYFYLILFSPLASACVNFLIQKCNIPPTINKYSAYLDSLIYHLVSDVCCSVSHTVILLLITMLTLKLCLRWGMLSVASLLFFSTILQDHGICQFIYAIFDIRKSYLVTMHHREPDFAPDLYNQCQRVLKLIWWHMVAQDF